MPQRLVKGRITVTYLNITQRRQQQVHVLIKEDGLFGLRVVLSLHEDTQPT